MSGWTDDLGTADRALIETARAFADTTSAIYRLEGAKASLDRTRAAAAAAEREHDHRGTIAHAQAVDLAATINLAMAHGATIAQIADVLELPDDLAGILVRGARAGTATSIAVALDAVRRHGAPR